MISCKKEAKATYLENDSTATAITQTEPNQVEIAKAQAAQSLLPNVSSPNAGNNSIQQVSPQTAAASGVGINPPHGQPGHRCEIPVGAPLNSAPRQNTTTQNVQTQPKVVTSTVPSQKTATAPGMNPPHGEPGHRCDIAVGAPLNSAPASKTTTPAPAPAPVAVNTQPAQPTVTAPGMNPPHGEPGHRCDIAVGAPLN